MSDLIPSFLILTIFINYLIIICYNITFSLQENQKGFYFFKYFHISKMNRLPVNYGCEELTT